MLGLRPGIAVAIVVAAAVNNAASCRPAPPAHTRPFTGARIRRIRPSSSVPAVHPPCEGYASREWPGLNIDSVCCYLSDGGCLVGRESVVGAGTCVQCSSRSLVESSVLTGGAPSMPIK